MDLQYAYYAELHRPHRNLKNGRKQHISTCCQHKVQGSASGKLIPMMLQPIVHDAQCFFRAVGRSKNWEGVGWLMRLGARRYSRRIVSFYPGKNMGGLPPFSPGDCPSFALLLFNLTTLYCRYSSHRAAFESSPRNLNVFQGLCPPFWSFNHFLGNLVKITSSELTI